ncbi:MAG: SDR family oxidoreductase [Chloroflexota bacterium]|nr:SDR family oxidoreductase [Chloroflexota bacterium]MDP9471410.1 SDR family oxidoreductase [Chloroflexota bacterium]
MDGPGEIKAGRVALITGATSGIGLELAKLLARDGHDLVLVSRTADRLDAVADDLRTRFGSRVTTIVKDLAQPAAVEEIVVQLRRGGVAVHVLVNNAGYAIYGPFAETNLQDELAMMRVNMLAVTHLTKLLLPDMLKRRDGKILNLASTAAFQPGPLMAVYYATKAYVLSFSQAVAEEVRGSGVTVTALCPGPTETGFQARAAMEESRLIKGRTIMDAATVAQAGYAGMLRGKTVVIPGRRNRVLAEANRFLPRTFVTRLVHHAQDRVDGA